MKVVLVGSGGREHALAWRIAQSPSLTSLVCTSAHPSWPDGVQTRLASGNAAIVDAARGADLVVVGPEAPLAEGLADALAAAGIPCFGPRREAARLEASKSFAKDVMAAAQIATAGALVVDPNDPVQWESAQKRCLQGAVVIKADGLAAGKGVIVCPSAAEAIDGLIAVRDSFGSASTRIVLEDLLTGPEASLLAICDGERAVGLPLCQDHKRLMDADRGPNTGGMGAYAPAPMLTESECDALVQQIHVPVLREMARRGHPFRGVLYAGLMLTPEGPRVLEFNARFGDPECQPLMALWADDILPWLYGAATGALPQGKPRFAAGSACCVVIAARGYPDSPEKGVRIPEPVDPPGVTTFVAGATRSPDGSLVTSGGRVLGVTAIGPDLRAARDAAYAAVPAHRFPGSQARSDIGVGGLG